MWKCDECEVLFQPLCKGKSILASIPASDHSMEPSYCEKYCLRRVSCFPQIFFLTRSWLLNSPIDFKLRRSTFSCNIKYYLIMRAIKYSIFCHEDTFFSCWTSVEDPNTVDYPTYLQKTAHLALCLRSPATNDTLLTLHMCWEME